MVIMAKIMGDIPASEKIEKLDVMTIVKKIRRGEIKQNKDGTAILSLDGEYSQFDPHPTLQIQSIH